MKNYWFVNVWKNGKYFDLWHVNHFLAGVLLGWVAIFLGTGLWQSLFVSLAIFIGWEIFEIIKKIEETRFNRCMDVILSVISFLVMFRLSEYVSYSLFFVIFISSLVVWVFLELWGYFSYRVLYDEK